MADRSHPAAIAGDTPRTPLRPPAVSRAVRHCYDLGAAHRAAQAADADPDTLANIHTAMQDAVTNLRAAQAAANAIGGAR